MKQITIQAGAGSGGETGGQAGGQTGGQAGGAQAGLPNTGLGNDVPAMLAVVGLLVVVAGWGIRHSVRRHSTR